MQLNRRPKLLPPLALLEPALATVGGSSKSPATRSSLSPAELRRIVADRIG